MTTPSRRSKSRIAISASSAIPLGLAWLLGTAGALSAAELRVDQVDLHEVQQAYAPVSHAGETSGGGPLRVSRRSFPVGFGTSGCSRLELALGGRAESLSAETGVDDTSGPLASVRFLVVGDGRVLYRGPWQQRFGPTVPLHVALHGVQRVALVADQFLEKGDAWRSTATSRS